MIDNESLGSDDKVSSVHQAWIASARAQIEQVDAAHSGDSMLHSGPTDLANVSKSIPGYRLHNILHRGGQGTVYRATQESTGQDVAIKVMHASAHISTQNRSRFEQEVQILAQIDHPNVVTIHDSGVNDAAIFIVMDYVRGESLDVWIQHNALTTNLKETLQLFAEICDAVNAAHLRGVIHRDLKPRNVLVDENGHARVLDFGLAKLTDDSRLAITPTMETEEGQFVGTLLWASPEQVGGQSSQIDVRTDVYSLGVVCHQMLTGTFPYEIEGGMTEVVRRIREDSPQRPSLIRTSINDEVETIVLKCLAKEPERRYQTAGEVARDIRRYFAGEAIEAKRDSGWYVLRKQIRRHRVLVTICGLVALLIVQAVVSLTLSNRRETGLRKLADVARDDAQRQARISEEVNRFLNEDILASVSPDRLGRDVSMRQALDAAAQRIGERFNDEPLIEAAIRMTIGDTLFKLGDYQAAEVEVERALRLHTEELGEDAQATLRSADLIGMLYERQSRFDEARKRHQQTLDRRRVVLGDRHPDTLASMNSLGMTYERMGRLAEAEDLHTRTLDAREEVLGEGHVDTLQSMNNLASVFFGQGHLDKAEQMHRRALDIRTRSFGRDHPETLVSMSNLGSVCRQLGRLEEAGELLQRALIGRQRVLGPAHSQTLGTAVNLAALYRDLDRFDEAAELLVDARRTARKELGDEHWLTATATSNLALIYQQLKRYDEAEQLSLEAIDLQKQIRGEKSINALIAIANYGLLLRDSDRLDEAVVRLTESLDGLIETVGPDHWIAGNTRSHLGDCLITLKRFDEAESHLKEAYRILNASLGKSHNRTQIAISRLIALYEATGDKDRAASYASELTDSQ